MTTKYDAYQDAIRSAVTSLSLRYFQIPFPTPCSHVHHSAKERIFIFCCFHPNQTQQITKEQAKSLSYRWNHEAKCVWEELFHFFWKASVGAETRESFNTAEVRRSLGRIKTARCTETFVMSVGATAAALLPLSLILAVQLKLAVSRYVHNTYHLERNTNVRTSANTHLGSSEKSTTAWYQL
jgi:hypothetical protein